MRAGCTFVACAIIALSARAARADVTEARVVRTHFTTDATNDAIMRVACALDAHTDIAGQPRDVDVRVTAFGQIRRCANVGPRAFAVSVQMYGHDVTVEADAIDDVPAHVHEIEEIVQGLADEIQERAARESAAIPKMEAYAPGLTIAGITIGAAGIGMLVTGYVWMLAQMDNFDANLTAPIALVIGGGAAMAIGAVFAIVGERRVPVRSASVAPYVAPYVTRDVASRASGATAGITVRF